MAMLQADLLSERCLLKFSIEGNKLGFITSLSELVGGDWLQVMIDGVPLTDLDIRWFRRQIGVVGQVKTFCCLRFLVPFLCHGRQDKFPSWCRWYCVDCIFAITICGGLYAYGPGRRLLTSGPSWSWLTWASTLACLTGPTLLLYKKDISEFHAES